MKRRDFLRASFAATAAGILVPEWLIDPPKGRSMISVPGFEPDYPVKVLRDIQTFDGIVPVGAYQDLQLYPGEYSLTYFTTEKDSGFRKWEQRLRIRETEFVRILVPAKRSVWVDLLQITKHPEAMKRAM